MELIRQAPGALRELSTAVAAPHVPANPGFIAPQVEDQSGLGGVWDAAVASFQRENTLVSLAQSLGHQGPDEQGSVSNALRTFNPFQLMADDAEFGDTFVNKYADAIAAGAFDYALSKDDIFRAAERWDPGHAAEWDNTYRTRIRRSQRLCALLGSALRRPLAVRLALRLLALSPALGNPLMRRAAGIGGPARIAGS